MPFIHVELVEGRSDEAKQKIAKDIIESVHKNANAPKKHIHVIFQDMKKTDYIHED
ncbi:2-hydroxymuconate tautomerase [Peptoniphilus raoultii]|uniref:2-hydroxymuconate tautomerase n=1 Tax=Peptoniphilus raoultii TaxID=1776387 RepID=UPI0008D9FFDD|nr:2-hydroxymuconate tautomerase [Peptoniphilus raoultii]